jgi:hypothetical protein
MGRAGACEFCGSRGDVEEVHYRQNTGLLIMRQSKELHGIACKQCSRDAFVRMTLHTAVFGWWGMISFCLTPIFIINNFYYFVRTLSLRTAEAAARHQLEDQRDYALALLATKEEEIVVEVLSKSTGAPESEVVSFVRNLRRSA